MPEQPTLPEQDDPLSAGPAPREAREPSPMLRALHPERLPDPVTARAWPARLVAGALGAGIALAVLALRDLSPSLRWPGRSRPAPPRPRGWRERAARWLRGGG